MEKTLQYISQNNIKSVLDIGANVGNFSRIIKMFFPDMDIFMIDGNPFCDAMLSRTGMPYKIACLSDTKKEVEFFLEDSNFVGTGASYYLEKTEHYSLRKHVKAQTELLDDLVGDKIFDLIKIDTQGSEIDVMKGGSKTISNAKYVLLETSLIEYNEGAPLQNEVFVFMSSIGYDKHSLLEVQYRNHNPANEVIQEDWIFKNRSLA